MYDTTFSISLLDTDDSWTASVAGMDLSGERILPSSVVNGEAQGRQGSRTARLAAAKRIMR